MTFLALICAASFRRPASSSLVGIPYVNCSRNSSANFFFIRRAVWLSISLSCFMRLNADKSSSCGSFCIPTRRRQQFPLPPDHFSIYESSCFHPRRLKYPTQKSARSETLRVSRRAEKRCCSMLSKMRGINPRYTSSLR